MGRREREGERKGERERERGRKRERVQNGNTITVKIWFPITRFHCLDCHNSNSFDMLQVVTIYSAYNVSRSLQQSKEDMTGKRGG